MAANPQPRPQQPPLAHDPRGLPIAVPDGTAGWRVKRQTAGRPKVVLGPDRQPLRLSLDATAADLLDMCGAGSFRLDAIDEVGQPIDFVTTVSVGVDGCGSDPPDGEPLVTPGAPRAAGGSELRFALEVTAHMARAQSEALRSIANAQADWIKGLASAKVLPRNGFVAMPPPPAPSVADDVNEEEDEDDEDDEHEAGADPSVTVLGHIASIARDVGPVLQAMLPSKTPGAAEHRNAPPPSNGSSPEPSTGAVEPDVATPSIRIATILARVSPEARALACRVLARDDQRARDIATALHTLPVDEAVAQLDAAIAKDGAAPSVPCERPPAVDPLAHMSAVMSRLAPDELARARALLAALDPARLTELKAELLRMSADDAAAYVRQAVARHGQQAGGGHVA